MGLFKSLQEYMELAKLQSRIARRFPSFAEQKKAEPGKGGVYKVASQAKASRWQPIWLDRHKFPIYIRSWEKRSS